ncbi:MAG TPA: trypsin-like peptidase domain-containing protein [Candidatus Paceibacterota bacterium]
MDDKRVIKVIKKVMPSVVSIAIAEKLEDLEKQFPKGFNPTIPDGTVDERGMVQTGGGSGFIVAPNGLILTNKHVVSEKKAEYTVILSDGRPFPATILSRDPINDVAILKIAADGLPCVRLGDATQLELGQSLIAIGNALGIFRNTVSVGIVSGLSRSITAQSEPDAPSQEMRGLIQTDAAINPGNSGGPIVDRDGYVVGVNAAIVSGAQSIGFAIPVNAAARDIDDIKKFGRINRPLLGVRYTMIDPALKKKMNLAADYGAFVMRESEHDYAVVPESPAEKAGIKENDIILGFNGKKLDREHPIVDFLENSNVGDEVELLILREGKQLSVKAILEERK